MFKTVDQDGDTRIDADEVMVMVASAMATELGADLELARKVVNGARDEYGTFTVKESLFKIIIRNRKRRKGCDNRAFFHNLNARVDF